MNITKTDDNLDLLYEINKIKRPKSPVETFIEMRREMIY